MSVSDFQMTSLKLKTPLDIVLWADSLEQEAWEKAWMNQHPGLDAYLASEAYEKSVFNPGLVKLPYHGSKDLNGFSIVQEYRRKTDETGKPVDRWYGVGTSMQNSGKHGERKALRAAGKLIAEIDLSAAHVRILAQEAGDAALTTAIAQGWEGIAQDLGVEKREVKNYVNMLINGSAISPKADGLAEWDILGETLLHPSQGVASWWSNRFPQANAWLDTIKKSETYTPVTGIGSHGFSLASTEKHARPGLVFRTVEGNWAFYLMNSFPELVVGLMHDAVLVCVPTAKHLEPIVKKALGFFQLVSGPVVFDANSLHVSYGSAWTTWDQLPATKSTFTGKESLQVQAYLSKLDPTTLANLFKGKKDAAKALYKADAGNLETQGLTAVEEAEFRSSPWQLEQLKKLDSMEIIRGSKGAMVRYQASTKNWTPLTPDYVLQRLNQPHVKVMYSVDGYALRHPVESQRALEIAKVASMLDSESVPGLPKNRAYFADAVLYWENGKLVSRQKEKDDYILDTDEFKASWVTLTNRPQMLGRVERELIIPWLSRTDTRTGEEEQELHEKITWFCYIIASAVMNLPTKKILLLLDGANGSVGDNGKTAAISAIEALFPSASSVLPGKIDSFEEEALLGSRLNTIQDLATDQLHGAMQLLKAVTGEGNKSLMRKNRPPISYEPIAQWIIGANQLPNPGQAVDKASWKRFTVLEFPRVFKANPEFKRTLSELRPWILLYALRRVEEKATAWSGGIPVMTEPECVAAVRKIWQDDHDTVLRWIQDSCVQSTESWIPVSEAWRSYSSWAKDKNVSAALKETNFKAAMKAKFPSGTSRGYARKTWDRGQVDAFVGIDVQRDSPRESARADTLLD